MSQENNDVPMLAIALASSIFFNKVAPWNIGSHFFLLSGSINNLNTTSGGAQISP